MSNIRDYINLVEGISGPHTSAMGGDVYVIDGEDAQRLAHLLFGPTGPRAKGKVGACYACYRGGKLYFGPSPMDVDGSARVEIKPDHEDEEEDDFGREMPDTDY